MIASMRRSDRSLYSRRSAQVLKAWPRSVLAGAGASEGLATGVRALVDREQLAPLMELRPDQRIVVAQTVGYPGP
jgi:hypothetical protein